MRRRLASISVTGVAVFLLRELMVELIFGSATDWLKQNLWIVGDIIAWRLSGVVAAAIIIGMGLLYLVWDSWQSRLKFTEGTPMSSSGEEDSGRDQNERRVNVSGHDNVVSVGQSGGQTARNIVNVGTQQRTLQNADTSAFLDWLRQNPNSEIKVTALLGNAESFQLAAELKELFESAGWKVDGISQAVYGEVPKGIKMKGKASDQGTLKEIGQRILNMGLQTEGWLDESASGIEIVVGAA